MLLTLKEWADATFGETKPSIITMRRWVSAGRIKPKAQKIGRTLYVEDGAKYVGRTRSDLGIRQNPNKKVPT